MGDVLTLDMLKKAKEQLLKMPTVEELEQEEKARQALVEMITESFEKPALFKRKREQAFVIDKINLKLKAVFNNDVTF